MTADYRCLNCGAPQPAAAPAGLCPRCLLRLGLGADLSNGRGESRATPRSPGGPAASVLDVLTATAGPLPRVELRDTEAADRAEPLEKPNSPELPDPVDRPVRLQLFGEIARGGMGAVLRGRDPDLGRELAVKVLLDGHRNNPELIRRFVEEAQIGGQLQHPGVIPIYELGTFGDRRPYFSMKLVKGRTMAELLAGGPAPDQEPARILAIFEQVAQTVAYAHSRGVIHRDLKPSNVMVGAFGEVQVMDWGLAKVLPRGGVEDDRDAGKTTPVPETVIAKARSGSGVSDRSLVGSVMGTPSYMAPEQARGEIDRIDERADVFALGSILCEVLTGGPAFSGPSSAQIQRLAARGETADALTRLDACGADPELIALARECLAAEPEGRPREAGAVAGRVQAYLAGVQDRLRTAERERAVAVARAVEERKRRRLAIALAASLLLFAGAIGGAWAWIARDRTARAVAAARTLTEAITEARIERERGRLGPPDDLAHWVKAVAACRRTEPVLAEGEADPAARARIRAALDEVRREAAQAEARVEAARADRRMSQRLGELWLKLGEYLDRRWFDRALQQAFGEYGIDIRSLDPAEAGRRIATRPTAIDLVGWLDNWIFNQQQLDDQDGVRRALAALDRPALRRLVDAIDPDTASAQTARCLALGLARSGEGAGAARLLKELQRRHPDDHWINSDLAMVLLHYTEPPPLAEVIRYATAAVAIQPKVPYARGFLARALADSGRLNEAIAEYRDLLRINPGSPDTHYIFGLFLQRFGTTKEATAEYAETIRLNPEHAAAHCYLGQCLRDEGRFAESLAEYRRGHELGSKNPNWPYPSKEWVRVAERLAALEGRLPALILSEDQPADAGESLDFAGISSRKGRPALAAKLFAEALAADPKLAEDRRTEFRYHAACVAALAGCGEGKDEPPRRSCPGSAPRKGPRLAQGRAGRLGEGAKRGRREGTPDRAADAKALAGRPRPGRCPRRRGLGQALRDRAGRLAGALGRGGSPAEGARERALSGRRRGSRSWGKSSRSRRSFIGEYVRAAPGALAVAVPGTAPFVSSRLSAMQAGSLSRSSSTRPGPEGDSRNRSRSTPNPVADRRRR
jgi:eukaryotic-like serine/threonine-protein kinase